MKIRLTDKYVMTSDDHNFIINQCWIGKDGKSKGKEMTKVVGYYPTVSQALEAFISKRLGESSAKDIKTLLDEHRAIVAHLKELFHPNKEKP